MNGFKHEFYVPFHIWDVILPIDELIFFKMVIAPPTSLYEYRSNISLTPGIHCLSSELDQFCASVAGCLSMRNYSRHVPNNDLPATSLV